jgi:hypothetical protein
MAIETEGSIPPAIGYDFHPLSILTTLFALPPHLFNLPNGLFKSFAT